MQAPSFSLGIEEEYFLVDPASRDLVARPSEGFMRDCKDRLADQVANEFLSCQVEVQTRVCGGVSEARGELARLRGGVVEIARAHGMAVIAAATHPFASWRDQVPIRNDRYDAIARDMQAVITRLVASSMHVHVCIDDPDLRILLMNRMVPYLPHLLAFTTSSPFWRGHATGLKAYRAAVLRDLPRGGLPDHLDGDRDWQETLAILSATGLVADGSKVWWDLRPSSKFPTLEVRVCDVCTSLDDTAAAAALYQALLATLYRRRDADRDRPTLHRLLIAENKWRAERYGVEGGLADFERRKLIPFAELTEELIALVAEEAERLGCLESIHHLRTIVAGGTSAERQLRAYAAARAAGADEREATQAVVDWLIAATATNL